MSLAPRVVLVHRTTEYEELVARHGTHGQAAFFLSSRGRDIAEVAERHRRTRQALTEVTAAIPLTWRQSRVERADLDRFLFAPEDVVVVVGQDGLVANVAKYLAGQPVLGIDTDPGRNPGVLVRHRPGDAGPLLAATQSGGVRCDELIMVEAVADDTQRLVALNEIYLGAVGHQTARYRLGLEDDGGVVEAQASSGVLIGTGTGATGWIRSVWQERGGRLRLPAPTEERLLWFVREAWPSPATGTSLVAGELAAATRLHLTVESERLVAFGDGMETDAVELTWGQTLRVGVCRERLRLVN
ncbi:inorganic polyphosphate kinase [Streptomyces viridochromogenes]|uniref:Inorganic polyphosphate kinase n=1 Tax=Streptomyces viridochromogenes TaxID=1938 RepID=A0A0J7Z6F6_STRVR|nr:NAD(+)/NADH kinase [Streptomyces viridochromogenes]KMS71776.1 inorganic polyphosphate kinase [Streptomyces viridochromogenes]KOG21065.1 inorganic polyphosphate kinase [Streptomyces viridochromogenes]KOG22595.1 inorganic polyphosphate kinase [Streptomyces viridochromogenes]